MLSESYAALHGDLSDDAIEKVASFQADFIGGTDADRLEMVKEALASVLEDDELADRLFGVINYASDHGDLTEKEAIANLMPLLKVAGAAIDKEAAFPGDPEYKSSGSMGLMGPAVAAAAAAPFISRMMRSSARRGKIQDSASEIYKGHPELRDDPHSKNYFGAISDFAPDIAANPMIAGNVMKAMHQIGPGSVTPKMLKELLEVQEQYDTQKHGPADSLQNFARMQVG